MFVEIHEHWTVELDVADGTEDGIPPACLNISHEDIDIVDSVHPNTRLPDQPLKGLLQASLLEKLFDQPYNAMPS